MAVKTVEVTATPPKGMLPIIATWRSLKTEHLGAHAIMQSAVTTWTRELKDKSEVGWSCCHVVNILRCTPRYYYFYFELGDTSDIEFPQEPLAIEHWRPCVWSNDAMYATCEMSTKDWNLALRVQVQTSC